MPHPGMGDPGAPFDSAALVRLIEAQDHPWLAKLAVATADVGGTPAPLWPEEGAAVTRAIPRRRAEFAAGRAAARAALAQLGEPPEAIPAGLDRAPIWPRGVVGSISHAGAVAIAVAARIADSGIAALGVDVEPDRPLSPDLIGDIADDAEIARLAPLPAPAAALRIFSLKEAAYKAQYPLTRQLLGFPDLRLTPDGLVFAHAVPPFAAGALLPAQQWVGGGLCLSLCLLEAADTP